MKAIIMGCGRVGAALANDLGDAGHDVVVIDRDPAAFDRLGRDFGGRTVTGVGFDRDVLTEAGAGRADAFAAVSSGDNSNIIAARVARERFGVERVIARIYDAGRAEVYERLGIPTVATVPWATGRLFRYVTDSAGPVDWRDQTGAVSLVALAAPHAWVGARVDDLAAAAGGRAAALSRFGRCRVPDARDLVQADDLLHLAVPTDTVETLESTLGEGPSDE
ncbi:MAG TPA: TrkA family potassium uptake protein [Candidatus Dietzia intestinipullorum]|nr:TrkA family potassium uptake protein [Candidatus Dietzia intestinipullorum]